MSELYTNESNEQLIQEIERLSNDLIKCQKYIQLLEKYRKYLLNNANYCKCKQNIGLKININSLENEYKLLSDNYNNNENDIKIKDEVLDQNISIDENEDNYNQNISKDLINNSSKDCLPVEGVVSYHKMNDKLIVCQKSSRKQNLKSIETNVSQNTITNISLINKTKQLINENNKIVINSKIPSKRLNTDIVKNKEINNFPKIISTKKIEITRNTSNINENYILPKGVINENGFPIENIISNNVIINSNTNTLNTSTVQNTGQSVPVFYTPIIVYNPIPTAPVVTEEEPLEVFDSYESRFTCHWPGCGQILESNNKLKLHIKCHENQREFKCDFIGCNLAFNTKYYLKIHRERVHALEKSFTCDECDFKTTCEAYVKLHKSHAHNKNDDRYKFKCDFKGCNTVLKSKHSLQNHQMLHKGIKSYSCDWPQCQYKCYTKWVLNSHKQKHTNTKSYFCDWPECRAKFDTKRGLVSHERRHNMDKAVKCDWPECDYREWNRSVLEVHKRKHTGEKPFACHWPECDKRFSDKSKLKDHIRSVHKNIQNIKCSFEGCERRFNFRGNMRLHLRTHCKN